MEQEELKRLALKARWLDEIVSRYAALRGDAGFYSRNWVELSELIEKAMAETAGENGPDD